VNDQIVHTTDAAFDADVVKSSQPVLLDFWAEWCSPCKMIAPILDAIADEYKDRLRVVKLNIDENPKTPPKYNIRGIPTLLLFRNGTVAAQQVGAVSKAQLESFLDAHLGAKNAQAGAKN
jgi:thioredoxin 1